jgi:hypothetical protein
MKSIRKHGKMVNTIGSMSWRQSCARAGCGAMATAFGAPPRGAPEFPAPDDPATRARHD